jgi:hypothetical protein
VWSITVRKELSTYFNSVEFQSAKLLDADLDRSDAKQRLLDTFAEPLELAFASRVGTRLVETVFPTPVYVSTQPK